VFSTQLSTARLVAALESPRGYEGVVLVARVGPVPAGHHAAEPLLEAAHCPRLVEVGLSQRNVANKLLEHRLLLIHTAYLAPVVVLVTFVHSCWPFNMDSGPLGCR